MRKALTILFAVLLACTFVSCSSGNPEPPADNRTQLERADEAISSVSHVFNGVAAEIDDKGNDVGDVAGRSVHAEVVAKRRVEQRGDQEADKETDGRRYFLEQTILPAFEKRP